MNILIAGGSGLIGKALIAGLPADYQWTVIGRDKTALAKLFPVQVNCLSWDDLPNQNAESFDVVINLCGHNIAASRWTDKVKAAIISSRVDTSQTLIDWLLSQEARPRFFCANAIGIYGMQAEGDETVYTEDSPIQTDPPKDFLSEIGLRWQAALDPAIAAGIAVTTTRFGVVLKKGEGFLAKLYPSFRLGLGSVIGSGQQVLSWIDYQDLVAAYQFLLERPDLTGAFNLTAPQPCTQAEFAHAFAKALGRPCWLKTPALVMKLLFGEMGDSLINHGQRVVPQRLQDLGFQFKWHRIEDALNAAY